MQNAHRYRCNTPSASHSLSEYLCIHSLTSTLAKLPVASPEDSDEGGSVMWGRLDVVVLPEEDVVAVLHAAETTHAQA